MTDDRANLAEPVSHLPLSPKDLQVLTVIFDQPMHGYGIVKISSEELDGRVLDLGSLYRVIGRLTEKGLIEDVTEEQDHSKRQRRYYRATDLGRQVARLEAARLRELLQSKWARLLVEKP